MRIKAKLLGATLFNHDLGEKNIVLPISVSQGYHEGEKFTATLELIKKRFQSCDIIIADTLQRYNYLNKYSLEEATTLTHQLGTEWIQRNIHSFEDSTTFFRIIRWSECLNSSGFQSAFETIKNQSACNLVLKEALEKDINVFIERDKLKRSDLNIVENCRNYLFEETAIVISYFVTQQYHFIAYPSPIPRFIEKCREFFVSNHSPELIRDLRIYFKKVGALVA